MTFHKKLITGFALFATLLGLALTNSSCTKSIPSSEPLTPLTPASADADAGTWRMIILSSPSQIPVAAPAAATDPAYQAELQALKTDQKNIDKSEKEVIAYWSVGGTLRWNEILRELVARADLPPLRTTMELIPLPIRTTPSPIPRFPSAIRPTLYAPTAMSPLLNTKH